MKCCNDSVGLETHSDGETPTKAFERAGSAVTPVARRRKMMEDLRSATLTELVSLAQENDPHAWNELLDRFSPMVRKKIREVEVSRTLAEDAFQSTWLKLANSLDRIREPERLPGWLAVTARNEAYSMLRKDWRFICREEFDDLAQPVTDPSSSLIAGEESAAVRDALTSLTDKQRALVQMRYLDDDRCSYDRISDLLDMRPGAIGPTLGRALVRMGAHPQVRSLL